jgi:TonB family protein
MKPDPTPTTVSSVANADSSESTTESNHSSVPSHKEYSPIDHVSELVNPEQMAREFFLGSAQQGFAERRRDYRTGALTAAVIVLSLLLGWMVGRAGWNMTVNRAQNQSPEVPEEVLAASQYSPPAPPRAEEPSNLAVTTRAAPASPPMSSRVPKSKIESVQPEGALVMYEGGKVIFRATPSQVTSPSPKNVGAAQTAVTRKTDSPAGPDQTLLAATNANVLTRVVPQYPDDARQQRIQGSVVLKALVGSDGSVQELKVISGNPQLVQAAANAVRQWRFQPHLLKEKPVEFETRITVNFSLP